ncbi:hypothetical protein PISL3812_07980 [Talaromyces islandicus]|uniref:Phosphoglycerate mutase family protein n=1 Tax=Talaromyces islandicus TaxID=28573 RepID=A0A0U1M5Q6_TALIS|nr:hypothetical protein PISL3812_07980 [Talaromyces islandicus]
MESKPPAVVIIARHGMRIDAVDKDWHLTSPTPYDPPLTYGGWMQGRALGARIASLLKAREESMHSHPPSASGSTTKLHSPTDVVPEDVHHTSPRKVRKHRVVIHSSPFLRCIQTSIAISAGMSQFQRTENERLADERLPTPDLSSEDVSPSATPFRSPTPNLAESLARLGDKEKGAGHTRRRGVVPKTRLRIDAFLGEWLSPDYYDQITPPPGSIMMVASAKGELLRRGEGLQRGNDIASHSLAGHFPGGWRNTSLPTSPNTEHDEGKLRDMTSLADALPSTIRSGNEDGYRARSVRGITIRDVLSRTHSHSHEDYSEGYIPPTPSYAISPADSIPTGYVSHARDACMDVDYQWDSMKDPQNWGDGGEYGEEWSAMHKRFRNGLLSLLDWYTHEELQNPPYNHHRHHRHHHHEDEETDTVVVLLTHGAGCNALIGAMTNQPVLIDVAMASLTMAVRKDVFRVREISHVPNHEGNNDQKEEQPHLSEAETSVFEEYDMSVIASTEHLDATSNPLAIPQLPNPALERSRSISIYRHRGDARPLLIPNSQEVPKRSNRGIGLQRASTTSSSHHTHSRGPSGLWGSIPHEINNGSVEEEANQMPDFSQPGSLSNSSDNSRPKTAVSAKSSSSKQPQEGVKSQRGLWSSATIAQERDPPTKRRWTVGERR